jgi:DNA-binding response OmpR family regulator
VDVVVIDDDSVALASITQSLSNQGFNITTFQDLDNGLHHILETPPDLAIIDILMPNTNGFELCKIIRQTEKTAKMPILILTASPSRENVEIALELAVNGFVAKPFDPRNLNEKVLQAVRQSQFKP